MNAAARLISVPLTGVEGVFRRSAIFDIDNSVSNASVAAERLGTAVTATSAADALIEIGALVVETGIALDPAASTASRGLSDALLAPSLCPLASAIAFRGPRRPTFK